MKYLWGKDTNLYSIDEYFLKTWSLCIGGKYVKFHINSNIKFIGFKLQKKKTKFISAVLWLTVSYNFNKPTYLSPKFNSIFSKPPNFKLTHSTLSLNKKKLNPQAPQLLAQERKLFLFIA